MNKSVYLMLILTILLAIAGCVENQEFINESVGIEENAKDEKQIESHDTDDDMESNDEESPVIFLEGLGSSTFDHFFEGFLTNEEYYLISNNKDDYTNLRVKNLLKTWNYNLKEADPHEIDDLNNAGNNIILIGQSCDDNVTVRFIPKQECQRLLENDKGILSFFESSTSSVLAAVGKNSQSLVDSFLVFQNTTILTLIKPPK